MTCAKCSVKLPRGRRSIWASDGRWYHGPCQPVGTYGLKRSPPPDDAEATARVTGLDEQPTVSTLAEILQANAHDDEVVEKIHKLWPGGSCQIGGGAAPLVTVERLT